MVRDPAGARGDVTGAPLIVTAELPGDIQAWAERLRLAHYPAERNRVAAHVTLFRALPPSCEDELRDVLAATARSHSPIPAGLDGLLSLGPGTALKIASPVMLALRAELAERFRGLLTPQDMAEQRLHITVQNRFPRRRRGRCKMSWSGRSGRAIFASPGLRCTAIVMARGSSSSAGAFAVDRANGAP